MIIDLSISPFNSYGFGFMYLEVILIAAYILKILIIS